MPVTVREDCQVNSRDSWVTLKVKKETKKKVEEMR
jgi:hypothetical protein